MSGVDKYDDVPRTAGTAQHLIKEPVNLLHRQRRQQPVEFVGHPICKSRFASTPATFNADTSA